jgi:signal transduction histidine kinase
MVGIYTQMLMFRHLPDNPQAKEFGGFVLQGVQRMEQLLQDLLSFSRTIHSDGAELGTVDLNESFAQALGHGGEPDRGIRCTSDALASAGRPR